MFHKKLETIEKVFQLAIEGGDLGIWHRNLITDDFFMKDQYKDFYDFDGQERQIKYSEIVERLHPDDREEVKNKYQHHIEGKTKILEIEFRIKAKEETYRTLAVKGQITHKDENGIPTLISGIVMDITEKKKSKEQQQVIGKILDNSNYEVIIHNAETCKIMYVNNGALKNLGYELKELQQKTLFDINPSCTNEHKPKCKEIKQAILNKEKQSYIFESSRQRKDGSVYPVEVEMQRGIYEGKPTIISYAKDIAERKKAEEMQRMLLDTLENSWNEVYVNDLKELKFIYTNKSAQNNTQYSIEELKKLTPYDIIIEKNEKEFLNAINALNTKDKKSIILESELKRKDGTIYSAELFIRLGYYIDKDVYITIVRDITKQKKIEKMLTGELDLAKNIINKSNSVAYIARNDERWSLEYITENVELLSGYKVKDFIEGKISFFDIINPDDLEKIQKETIKACKNYQNIVNTSPYRLKTKNGNEKIIQNRSYIERDENENVIRFTGIADDVTEKVIAEQKLTESHQKYQTLFDSSNDAILLVDIEKKLFYDCNQTALNMFECDSKDDFCKLHPTEISSDYQQDGTDSLTAMRKFIKISLETGHCRFEWLGKRLKSKENFSTDIIINSMQLDGKNVLQLTIRDIVERKKTEQQIKESEAKYRGIIENSLSGYYRADRNGNITIISPTGAKMLGYEVNEMIGKNAAKNFYKNPEDRERFVEEIKVKGRIFNIEALLRRKDGSELPVLTCSGFYYDENKQIAGIEGTFFDITSLKQAQKELEQANEELERFNSSMMDREEKVLELKQEVNDLLKKLGEKSKYKTAGLNFNE